MHNWPLADSNFTWLDRLKICKFFLNPKKQWTSGPEVKKYEQRWVNDVQSHCLMVSSGSAANTLIAQYTKNQLKNRGEWRWKKYVILPTIGWMTSFEPFIREGFVPIFVDVNMVDLSMDLDKLERILRAFKDQIGCVFIVSLLGFSPNIDRLLKIKEKYKVDIKLDNCESSDTLWRGKSINSYFTSSTSLYFSHLRTCGGESGLIFTQNREEFKYYVLASNHGMVRGLIPYIKNTNLTYEDIESLDWNELIWEDHANLLNKELKDSRFDFAILGNNYRSTDTAAFIAGLDLDKKEILNNKRENLYANYMTEINRDKFHVINSYRTHCKTIPFAIPIIIKGKNKKEKAARFNEAMELCKRLGIENRLLVSGNILRQTAFKNIGEPEKFKNTEDLHNFAFYVGLNPKLERIRLLHFVNELNKL